MHCSLLVTRFLQSLGALVIVFCAVEGVCGLVLRHWFAARHVERPLGLDTAVGYGPQSGRHRRMAGTGRESRFFKAELFRPPIDAADPGDAEEHDSRPMPLRILALGGSTTDPVSSLKHAGAGGDWPHLLGRELAAHGRTIEIANGGLVGCLAAQELTRLIAILPDQHFDLVISLTGINEIYSADRGWYQDPDERMSPKFLLAAFEELADGGTLSAGGQMLVATGFMPWVKRRTTTRLMGQLWRKGFSRDEATWPNKNVDSADWERLAKPVVLAADRRAALERAATAWLAHVRLMAAVSEECGARYVAVLQPAMGVGLTRTELVHSLRDSMDRGEPDAAIRTLLSRPGYLESIDLLYRFMREGAAGQPWFVDFSGPEVLPASATWFHSPRYPNADGNQRIALRLAEAVVPTARPETGRSPSASPP